MLLFLRILFAIVLASMLVVTSWASLRCPLFAVPREVATHPWFIATLFDAYWGFITFYVWVCYKEVTTSARTTWLIAILLLGNIAMASYCLRELFSATAGNSLGTLLTLRRSGKNRLGVFLALAGIGVTVFAAAK